MEYKSEEMNDSPLFNDIVDVVDLETSRTRFIEIACYCIKFVSGMSRCSLIIVAVYGWLFLVIADDELLF